VGSSAETSLYPKHTNDAPFTALRSYSHIATTLCSPSRLTISMTYSWPSKYSCTSTALLTRPNPFTLPMICRNAILTSSALEQKVTSSDPALSTGFTTTAKGSGFHSSKNAAISPHVVALTCLAERSPEPRMVSPIKYLSLRVSVCSVPFDRSPRKLESLSANSTPVSAPANTAKTGHCN